MIFRGDAGRLPFQDQTFDLCIGSPPYIDARDYLEDGRNLGISLGCLEWVEWMLRVTMEAQRVTRGPVIWIVAGVTRNRNYQPGPEGLLWEWWKRGGECQCLRPVYWHRNGIAGSGGDQWFRSDTEYCLCFKRPGRLPYANPLANGHPPKWAPGGEMSHRLSSGARVNQWGGRETSGGSTKADGTRQKTGRPSHKQGTPRRPDGTREVQKYVPPTLANPGNLFHTNSGGGQMGHVLAHENEAPFPVDVPKFFISSFCPKGGCVLDPFLGSGTTLHAAMELGVAGVGCDVRQSQCVLATRRVRGVTRGFEFQGERDGCEDQ